MVHRMAPTRIFDFDALRAHEPFARRLARSLVRDSAAAEDAVQDAWLRAMHSPPRPEGNLRGWFLEVTRNVVRQALRRDSRRQRRERASIEDGSLPSPDEVIARERTRRELLEALFALEEPYRSTLIWTFLEDLSAAELARRLGIPASTVRNRVKRGLERLRQDLERANPGADWRAPIVAWLRIVPRGTGGAVMSSQAVSHPWVVGALMRETVLVAGVLTGLTVACWALSRSDPELRSTRTLALEAEERTALDTEPATVPVRREVESDILSGCERDVAGAIDAERRYGSVQGILRRTDGSPAAGVEIAVIASDPALRSSVPFSLRAASVRKDGSFEITRVPPSPQLSLVVGIGEGASSRTLERAPSYGERIDLGVIELPALGGVRGRVVDGDGRPLAGAEVRALRFDGHARTLQDLASRFRFDLLRSGVRFVVKRERSGSEPRFETFEPPGALIERLREIGIPCTRTDANGEFLLRGIAQSSTHVVALAADRMGAFRMGVRAAPGATAELGDLVLERAQSIRGRILDSTTDPVANAEILVGPMAFEGDVHALVPSARSAAGGEFEALGLPARPFLVAARLDPRDPFTVLGPLPIEGSPEVTLPTRDPLVLSLHSRERGAVDGANAKVSLFAGTIARDFGRDWALDVEAEFRVVDSHRLTSRSLPHGEYTVRVEVPGFAPFQGSLRHGGSSEHRIELERGHALTIEVEDPSGAPVAGAVIRLIACSSTELPRTSSPIPLPESGFPGEAQALAFSSESGEAQLRDLPEAEYELFVEHPGLGRSIERIVVPRDRVAVSLVPYPVVRGRILADGLVPSRVRSVRLESLRLLEGGRDLVLTTLTDVAGRFEFRGVPPGVHRLSSREPEGWSAPLAAIGALLCPSVSATSTTTEVDVPATGERFVWHEESPNHAAPAERALEVVGTIRCNGVPAIGMRIDVLTNTGPLNAEPIAARSATTSATGDYWITALAPPRAEDRAACFMLFDRAGRWLLSRPDVVLKDDVTRVDLSIELGSVRGCVRGPHGEPIVCLVSFSGGGDGYATTREVATAADGTYTIDDLPRGSYSVRAWVGDRLHSTQEMRVAAGGNSCDIHVSAPTTDLPISSLPENPSARTGMNPVRRGDTDR